MMRSMIDLWWLAPLLAGFFGSSHCLSMCGGIASSLGGLTAQGGRTAPLLLFQLGRIGSYSIAGALVAGMGWSLAEITSAPPWLPRFLIGVFLVICGVWLALRVGPLTWLGRWGHRLWVRMAPLAKTLLPLDRGWKALALGGLWGWLPCGLVYSMLPAAAATADAVDGGLWMALFGLGTAPAMFALGWGGQGLMALKNHRWLRCLVGLVFVAVGVWSMLTSGLVAGDAHRHHSP